MVELTGELVQALLERRDVALAEHRGRLARRLRVTDGEMLALVHLARERECTPSRLGGLLGLSSGGITAMLQRLETAGLVQRRPHPRDRRSHLVRLAPAVAERMAEPDAAVAREVERLGAELTAAQRTAVGSVLTGVVAALGEVAEPPPTRAVPSLWA